MKKSIMRRYNNDIGFLLGDALKKGVWGCIFIAALLILAGGGITL